MNSLTPRVLPSGTIAIACGARRRRQTPGHDAPARVAPGR
jgi:hypothetical protein